MLKGQKVTKKKTVLIFRSELLRFSETCILNHYKSLQTYEPILVGWQKAEKSFDLTDVKHVVISKTLPMSKLRLLKNKYVKPDKSVIALIKKINPSIIHAHFGPDAVQISKVCKQLKIPLIVTIHGYDATFTTKKLLLSRNIYLLNYYFKRKNLAKNASKVLPVSKYIAEMAFQNGFSKANMTIHYLGGKMINESSQLEISSRRGILFVGRLVEKKGLNFLLSALALTKGSIGDIVLTVIGNGPLKETYQQQAKELNINANFLGELHNDEVMNKLRETRIFCMPSSRAKSGDNEGLPTVFMESLSLGTPIVAFDQGPIPEIVMENLGGYLAIDKDVESLANKIIEAFTNDDQWQKNSIEGLKMVNDRFGIKHQTLKLESIYDTLNV
jgi:glycosyltransferase involved in cell wall biosynthesis